MKLRSYKVVDVFTNRTTQGNPVAVVLDAEGLDTSSMQNIARWTNLSETTFLLPPTVAGADYRLRIFTPQRELPFAGHPTLGSAFAALEADIAKPRDGKLVQECGVGVVKIDVKQDDGRTSLSFCLPPARITPLEPADIEELEAILNHGVVRERIPMVVNVGAVWVVAQLLDVETLLALKPDFIRSSRFENRLGATGLSVFAIHETGDKAIEVRSFAPSCGVNEDPVCGSGNGSVAVFLRESGLVTKTGTDYIAGQGQCIGRNGRVSVKIEAGAILVGGSCVTSVSGMLAY